MPDMLAYVEIIADVFKKLFKEWDNVETVAKRFIDYMEQVALTILHK